MTPAVEESLHVTVAVLADGMVRARRERESLNRLLAELTSRAELRDLLLFEAHQCILGLTGKAGPEQRCYTDHVLHRSAVELAARIASALTTEEASS